VAQNEKIQTLFHAVIMWKANIT